MHEICSEFNIHKHKTTSSTRQCAREIPREWKIFEDTFSLKDPKPLQTRQMMVRGCGTKKNIYIYIYIYEKPHSTPRRRITYRENLAVVARKKGNTGLLPVICKLRRKSHWLETYTMMTSPSPLTRYFMDMRQTRLFSLPLSLSSF